MSSSNVSASGTLGKDETKVNWLNTIFLLGSPFIALFGGYWHATTYGVGWAEVIIFFAWYWACGLSITVGYHRLFSHRSHEASPALVLFYSLFGAAAFQNSIIEWCSDHRDHHKFTDNNSDPYNAKRGFLWSHIGWILVDETGEPDFSNVRDLAADPIIAWQGRHIFKIGIFIGMIIPGLIGFAFGGIGGGIGGFIWGGLIRTVFVHHGTFLINSAAHVWGRQPYSSANTSKDSFWLAFFTFGEGYHNFHHSFQADYRNGHRWFHYDPSKWWISSFSLLKLNRKLKRTPAASIEVAIIDGRFEKVKARILRKDATADLSQFEMKLNDCRRNLRLSLRQLGIARDEYKAAISSKKELIKTQIQEIKQSLIETRTEISNIFSDIKIQSRAHAI